VQGEFLLATFGCVSVILCGCEIGSLQLREARRGGHSSQGGEKEIVQKRIMRATIIITALMCSIPHPVFIR